jgi:NmrA-like family
LGANYRPAWPREQHAVDARSHNPLEGPEELHQFLIESMRPLLPEGFDIEKHFTPRYRPWQQRIAIVPEGDLFAALREGKALALPPDQPLQQIDRVDLGRFVARVIAAPRHYRGQRIELAGDAPTPADMAAAIGAAAGYTVTHDQVSLADVEARSPDLAAMFGFLAQRGYSVDIPALRRAHPELGWTSFADWAQRQSWPERNDTSAT